MSQGVINVFLIYFNCFSSENRIIEMRKFLFSRKYIMSSAHAQSSSYNIYNKKIICKCFWNGKIEMEVCFILFSIYLNKCSIQRGFS